MFTLEACNVWIPQAVDAEAVLAVRSRWSELLRWMLPDGIKCARVVSMETRWCFGDSLLWAYPFKIIDSVRPTVRHAQYGESSGIGPLSRSKVQRYCRLGTV